jgi:hypothetical protein
MIAGGKTMGKIALLPCDYDISCAFSDIADTIYQA